MTEHVRIDVTGGVQTLTLARPEKKNAITRAMYAALADGLAAAAADPAIRVTVLAAEGDVFTAGNDLMDFVQHPPGGSDTPVMRFLHNLSAHPKPVVAKVQGQAVGIGLTMLLHCDLAYAADHASLKAPFVDLGLVPEAGSSLVLPGFLGHRHAFALFVLGEALPASEAVAVGLLNAAVPAVELDRLVAAKVERLRHQPPAAVRATKALMRKHVPEIQARMAEEGAAFAERLQSPELAEAVAAFMARRAPDFSRFS